MFTYCDNIWQKVYSFINIVYGGAQIACPTYVL